MTDTRIPTAPAPVVRRRRRRRSAEQVGSGLRYLVLGVLAAVFLIPFYLLARNALSTNAGITSPHWQFFPRQLQ